MGGGARSATPRLRPSLELRAVRFLALIAALLVLAGCSVRTSGNFGTVPATSLAQSSVQVQSGTGLTTLLGLAVIGALVYDSETQALRYRSPYMPVIDNSSQRVPELAPDRKVSEQDCTRPVDYSLGNIRCK
jgi:hypothetical protein